MKYLLALRVLGSPKPIEITPAEFTAIRSSSATLRAALDAEEKYDMVIENYAEYERELLSLTVERMLHRVDGWSVISADSYTISRRLANMLTVSRSYIEQVKHDLKSICGSDSDAVEALDASFKAEYDRLLGYRVMEALRNYLQHRGFPVSLSYHSSWIDNRIRMRYTTTPLLALKELTHDCCFKRSVYRELVELADEGQDIDLTASLREYLEGLSHGHSCFRRLVSEFVPSSQVIFEQVIQRARKEFGDKILGLAACLLDTDDQEREVFIVSEAIPQRLELLKRRNQDMQTLSRWYVSSEVLPASQRK